MPVPSSDVINPAGIMPVKAQFDSAAAWSQLGRRYVATHQTPTSLITAQTSFSFLTPTFLLRQVSSDRDIYLRSITLSQAGTAAGGTISIVVIADSADRYAAGGIPITPQCLNLKRPNASVAGFYANPSATADTPTRRVVLSTSVPAQLGLVTQIDTLDGLILPPTGSLLVHVFSAAPAPQLYFAFEWVEMDTV